MNRMEVPMRAAVLIVLAAVCESPASAQDSVNIVNPPPPLRSVNLSGPRFGFTSLSDGVFRA